ncbi:MAG: DedA family protein/thiosulfate sulfurtransferase GlpE [Gammaproteobacteria bacterium]|nr:DedA family protein/thiosulfate sulfurtransferase GlpE [Gammaproteobacteria bacterium]
MRLVAHFGLSLVFFNVLLEQLGLPVPAIPTLVVAGALAADGQLSLVGVGALALGGCLIGDSTWYIAGRVYGVRVMRLLCRISLTPDICVSRTQSSFERWGARALIVAKFVPGLGLIAPPLAGATRMSYLRFAANSVLGSALWVTAALLAGALLREQILLLLPWLASVGGTALGLLLLLLGVYVVFKWWERRRFYAALEMARISVADLHAQITGGKTPVIVDVRSATTQGIDLRRIPGALHVPLQEVARHMGELPLDSEIVLYCNCPNEASAAQAARVLLDHGFRRVRPLGGGLDAWIAAGFAVEETAAAVSASPTGNGTIAASADAGGRSEITRA